MSDNIENKKTAKSFSVLSIISSVISVLGFVFYAMLLDGKGFVYIPWLAFSVLSIIVPIIAKYIRKRQGKRGKAFEIAAMAIGAFDFYFVFFAATKIDLNIIFVVIGVICVLYAKLFNNVEVKTMPKKENPQEELWTLLAEAMSEANKNRNEKGPVVFNGQRPHEADYGISPRNPLCSTSLTGTDTYLGRLRTMDGKKFTWQRIGDVRADCNGATDIGMDKYQLFLDGKPHKVLYFVPYVGESKAAPHGMKLYGATEQDTSQTANISATTVHKQTVKVKVKKHPVVDTEVAIETHATVPEKKILPNARFCSRCGAVIDSTTKKCTGCGKQYFKAKRLMFIFIPVLLCAVLLSAGVYFITVNEVIPMQKYSEAEQMHLEGNHKAAATAFAELGNYKDAAQRALDCQNDQAIYYIDNGKYNDLKNSHIRQYGLSIEVREYIKETVTNAIDQEKYTVAYKLIPVLDSVPLHQEILLKKLYQAGLKHWVNEEYKISNSIFNNLGDYLNSAELINYEYEYSDAVKVTIQELKTNPQKYDGQRILLRAVVWTVGDFFYVVDQDYYELYPKATISARDFEKTRHVYVIRGYECEKSPETLEVGQEVLIIGQFLYEAEGEEYSGVKDGKIVTLKRTENYAELRAKVVYYDNHTVVCNESDKVYHSGHCFAVSLAKDREENDPEAAKSDSFIFMDIGEAYKKGYTQCPNCE